MSSIPEVREVLLEAQRELARDGAVAVGRDCGTVASRTRSSSSTSSPRKMCVRGAEPRSCAAVGLEPTSH